MSNSPKNIDILRKIIGYCRQIDEANEMFKHSFNELTTKYTYKNAVAMCILQIGELTTHLSDDFKATYNEMPWQDIKGIRNIAAHRYGSFDVNKLWETITVDVPALKAYCESIVRQHEVLEQGALSETELDSDKDSPQTMQ